MMKASALHLEQHICLGPIRAGGFSCKEALALALLLEARELERWICSSKPYRLYVS